MYTAALVFIIVILIFRFFSGEITIHKDFICLECPVVYYSRGRVFLSFIKWLLKT